MDENKWGFVYSDICVSWGWQPVVLVAEVVYDGFSLLWLLFVHVRVYQLSLFWINILRNKTV